MRKSGIFLFVLCVFWLGSALGEEGMVRVPVEGDSIDGFFPCEIADEGCNLEKAKKNRKQIKAFHIDINEVSVEEVKACVASGKCSKEEDFPMDNQKGDKSAYLCHYDKAEKYCHLQGKRLPKAEEWLTAASGSELKKYPWGMTYEKGMCMDIEERGEVGSYPRDMSVHKVFDMGCNSLEWVEGALKRSEIKGADGVDVKCMSNETRPCMGKAPYGIYEQFGCEVLNVADAAAIRCVK